MSQISGIYDAIVGISLTGVNVRGIDDIKLKVRSGDLPMRMLIPSTSGEGDFVAIGDLTRLIWTIRDLCLWAPLSAGAGVGDSSEDMVAYINEYITAIKALRNPTSQSNIIHWEWELGPVPWADGDYWAIDFILTIQEII